MPQTPRTHCSVHSCRLAFQALAPIFSFRSFHAFLVRPIRRSAFHFLLNFTFSNSFCSLKFKEFEKLTQFSLAIFSLSRPTLAILATTLALLSLSHAQWCRASLISAIQVSIFISQTCVFIFYLINLRLFFLFLFRCLVSLILFLTQGFIIHFLFDFVA